MTDLDDNDLADIRKMQRMQAPSARSLVVNLAVFGPTLVIGILGLTLGLYVGRVRIIFGALVFALSWGVGASRSWDRAVHQRKQQLWLRVAGACIVAALALAVTLFITLDVRHRLFGYPLSDSTAAALRTALDEHTALLARRAERYRTVGGWRERLGPRPDLGACPDASGEADDVPRSSNPYLDRGLDNGPTNVTAIFPSGVPIFEEVDTAPRVAVLHGYLTRPSRYPADEEHLMEEVTELNTQPERLVFLVVDQYVPATNLNDGTTIPGSLQGTAFTLTTDADRPICAAYVDMRGIASSVGYATAYFAEAVGNAVSSAPFYRAGDVAYRPPTLDPARVALVNDAPTPLPDSGRLPLAGTDAWLEVAPLLTYTGVSFSLQHPSHVLVGDSAPRQAVELMDTDGTVVRVARGDCATLNASYGAIVTVLESSGTMRSATRMIGNARARGAAATQTPGTMEVFLSEDPPEQQVDLAGSEGAAVALVADPQAEPRCTLVFMETPRAIPPQWVATTLASVRDEHAEAQHPEVPLAELVQGETRSPVSMNATLTVPGTDVRVQLLFNPARMAQLAGLRVRVPAGAFARVSEGTGNESEVLVLQGALELRLRVALAPSSLWPSSAERLSLMRPGSLSAPVTLLGAPRVGTVTSEAPPQRVFAFDHAGRMLEVSITAPGDVPTEEVDRWLRGVLDTITSVGG